MSDILAFSRQAPKDSVKLAWIQVPPLDPEQNVSLVETVRYIAENLDLTWKEPLANVDGVTLNGESFSGDVYITTYNFPISGSPASGEAISTGIAFYRVPRQKSAEISPSGFVIQNFTSQIRVLPPVESESGVWRVRLEDGVIQRRHILREIDASWLRNVFSAGDELMVFYSIPEMAGLSFNYESPSGNASIDARIMDVSGIVATILDEKTIKLTHEDIVELRSVTVNGEQLILSPTGMLHVDFQLPPRGPFTAWKPLDGEVSLGRTVSEDSEIVVSYRYHEYNYVFEGYVDDSGLFRNIDFNPSPGHTYDRGRPTSELLNIPVYLYLIPTAAYRIRDANGNTDQERKIYTGTRWTNSFLRWERTAGSVSVAGVDAAPPINPCRRRSTFGHDYFGLAKFISDLPVDNIIPANDAATGLAFLPSAIVLAKIYVTPNGHIDNVDVIDVRSRGGGIPDTVDITDVSLPGETRAEVDTYWDIGGWSGSPIPLSGVLLVEVPSDILTGTNGFRRFTQDEVEQIVKQHVATGIKVIIRYV